MSSIGIIQLNVAGDLRQALCCDGCEGFLEEAAGYSPFYAN
jgi:hypothetical protein